VEHEGGGSATFRSESMETSTLDGYSLTSTVFEENFQSNLLFFSDPFTLPFN